MRGRWIAAGGTALVLLVVGVLGVRVLVRPPRPDLPLPAGQTLAHIRGNCATGNELIGCSTAGPRSFLTVQASGDPRAAVEALFALLVQRGWTKDDAGRTARDYAASPEPEDLQPVYCQDGCVGLFRLGGPGYELAWFTG